MRPRPPPIDAEIGWRIRLRRREARLTQRELAQRLGVTYQQIQKYEMGQNRISVSTLHRVATVLQAAPARFFEGLPATGEEAPGQAHREPPRAFLATPEGSELAAAFLKLDPRNRRRALRIVRDLAEADD